MLNLVAAVKDRAVVKAGVTKVGLVQVWIDEMREARDVRVRLAENIWDEFAGSRCCKEFFCT
jgi:hypothetical protein